VTQFDKNREMRIDYSGNDLIQHEGVNVHEQKSLLPRNRKCSDLKQILKNYTQIYTRRIMSAISTMQLMNEKCNRKF
jgi:hypothetical protein